jgi:hypothetical protein
MIATQVADKIRMPSPFKDTWSIEIEETQVLFAELDRHHYGGRLAAAGYRVKLTVLPGNRGQFIPGIRRSSLLISSRLIHGWS